MRTPRLFILIVFLCTPFYLYSGLNDRQFSFRSLDISHGLSQNTVHAILQDKRGFMWFGTKDGLDRYDGISFQTFKKETGTLGNNFITALHEDKEGYIWIGTDIGLYVYDPQKEYIERFSQESNLNTVIDHTVIAITGDIDGGVWVTSQGQGVFYYNPDNCELINHRMSRFGKTAYGAELICFDPDNVCWIDMHDGNLYYSDDKLQSIHALFPENMHYTDGYHSHKLVLGPYNCMYIGTVNGLKELNLTNKTVRTLLSRDKWGDDIFVRDIKFCTDNELWVGTESGLYIYNVLNGEATHLESINGDIYSISDNAVYSICKDQEGGVWIGTYFGGVNYYPNQYTSFDKVYPRTDNDEMGKRVREFCSDKDGTLWIGTEDKGLFHYNPSTGAINSFKSPLIYRNVHGLCMDDDYLWVGTFSRGLSRIDLRTNEVKHYRNVNNDIFAIYRTVAGELWVGSPGGLSRYNRDTDTFEEVHELLNIFVYNIKEDKQGNLWLATYVDGLYKRNVRTGKLDHFVHNDSDTCSLPSNKVLSIFEDSKNRMWFTTQGEGFCRFEPETETFVNYNSNIGLPSNIVHRIEEDDKGLFWITTNKGLLHFNPETRDFKVYTTANGLLSNQFNYQSGYKDKNGRIYFGNINGFISFDPSTFAENDFIAPVVITDFSLFNMKVPVGTEHSPLEQSITFSDRIELESNQNSFSLGVAVLSYQSPEMNTLMHKLEGYDKDWYPVNQGSVSYSNLPYGTYTLKIKGANSDGIWNPDIRTLQIRILPPFYLSVWAYCIYFLLTVGILVTVFIYFKRRTVNKNQREMEKFEQKKERELYTAKIDFFTNVAHEIRTPLTLIKSPLESVLHEKELSKDVRMELEVMDQNAERLLNLTNQLLDFRKTENKGFKLDPVECNISELVASIYKRFTALAKQRKINFTLETLEKDLWASVDREALTKIISNMLTNALKHAESHASLSLSVDENESLFFITTRNDGKVVPIDKREEIFRPFVQYRDEKTTIPGTGIGLALARSLAELHQGTLLMEQSTDLNCFTLTIPVVHQQKVAEPDNTEDLPEPTPEPENASTYKERKENYSVLVVEDNKDMQSFIARQLSPFYNVFTADDGLSALEILKQEYISLVVSDVMMPGMDGFELCLHIKSTLDYSHIPVILLTAKTTLESKIEGLEQGADAYIEKPFPVEYLRVTVANLLSNRERLRRKFIESPFAKSDTMALSKADEVFIQKLNKYISEHLDNTNLIIDDMAEAMNMGRSNFYRKLKGIMGMSPNEYLRLERLKKAAQFIKEGEHGIVEISYMVGFSSPSYFSNCFKKQFGVLPKDFE